MSSIDRRGGTKLGRMIARALVPVAEVGRALGYARTVTGITQYFFMGSNGVEQQFTGISNHQLGVQSVGVGTAAVVGAAKGSGASDLQTDRTAAAQVASGDNSFAAGRRNTASGAQSVALGDTNTASGAQSVALGSTNTAPATNCVCIGNANSNGLSSGVAIGGNCTTTGQSMATGFRATSTRQGQFARANGRFAADGDAQYSLINFRRVTTDATATELTLDGTAPASGTSFVLANNIAYTCRVLVTGRNVGAVQAAGYSFEFLMDRAVGAATVRFVGAAVKTILGEDNAAWDANVVMDVVAGSLTIMVTGVAATTIRWTASMWFNEVRTA